MISPGAPLPPASRQAEPRDATTDLNLSGRDTARDPRRNSDPQADQKFGKAMQKALAATRKPAPDSDPQPQAVAFAPLAPPPVVDPPAPLAATAPQHQAQSVADRIDRYLRGAEGQSALREGQSMTIRLPSAAMGLSQVTVTLRDGVVQIGLALADNPAAQAQLALLGQAIAQRQPKLAFRLGLARTDERDEAEGTDAPPAFDPLQPQRSRG